MEAFLTWWRTLALLAKIGLGYIAYWLALLATMATAYFFFGIHGTDLVVDTLGIPGRASIWLINKVYLGLSWPWRYRYWRLRREAFDILPGESKTEQQKKVFTYLGHLAAEVQWCCDQQEYARKHGDSLMAEGYYQREVDSALAVFWANHQRSRKLRYAYYSSWGDYTRFAPRKVEEESTNF